MPWADELEVIDQLCGGDLPLRVIVGMFRDVDHARRVLRIYIDKNVVTLSDEDRTLPQWECQTILRDSDRMNESGNLRVHLTEYGAKMFNKGLWEQL
jgi:hypothetical protein